MDMLSPLDTLANKHRVRAAMDALVASTPDTVGAVLAQVYHPQAQWRGPHPWNELQGLAAIEQEFWRPFLQAFPDLERRDSLLLGGSYDGRHYVGAVGHLVARFRRHWQGLPPTDQVVFWRYGEFHQIQDGLIVQSTVLLDVLDFLGQIGLWPLMPSRGAEGRWPGPLQGDGLVLSPQDPAESAASLALTLAMQASLGDYDDTLGLGRQGLLEMPQRHFWHPNMMWFGPSGIGTSRGLEAFVDVHQLPFRTAFPRDPKRPQPAGMGQHGGSHYVRIGDGRFSATGGWPSRHMMHLGGGWLGLPPTGRPITMRVMDFYAADGGLIRENWVPIDLLNVLLQMDVDVLARVRGGF
jgi:SnoaL-like domain/SnoaL-like polyketide cyclase